MLQLSRFIHCKACIFGLFSAVIALAGCAPGVSGRSTGWEPQPAPETVEAQPASVEPAVTEPEVVVVEQSVESPTTAQLRRQEREIAQLRDELAASRSRADSADAAARQAQQAVVNMQAELADIRARTDAASAQSQQALDIATEFLSNLVAAREEQRSIVERNLKTFDAMDQRLASIENLFVDTRKQHESDAAAALVVSTETELKLQKADRELVQLREQLAELSQHNEETRAAIDSAAMT